MNSKSFDSIEPVVRESLSPVPQHALSERESVSPQQDEEIVMLQETDPAVST